MLYLGSLFLEFSQCQLWLYYPRDRVMYTLWSIQNTPLEQTNLQQVGKMIHQNSLKKIILLLKYSESIKPLALHFLENKEFSIQNYIKYC